MNMQSNPEFRRQLWLQLSATRLILAPVVIAIVVALLASTEPTSTAIHGTAWVALSLTVLFWGTSVVGTSIRDEITGRTWNQQRMSRLTPWQLTAGKLFGATSYVWYVALLCALVAIFSGRAASSAFGPHNTAIEYVFLLALGLFAHSVALMAPLAFQSGSGEARVSVPSIAVFALVFVAFQAAPLGVSRSGSDVINTEWFGMSTTPQLLAMWTALSLAAWGLLGAWRAMRQALQVRQIPWALPAFLAFMGVWVAGSVGPTDTSMLSRPLIGATLALALAAWVLMLWEPQSLFAWQRIRTHWAAGERTRAIAGVSAATSVVVCAVIGALIVAAVNAMSGGAEVAGAGSTGFFMQTAMSSKVSLASHAGAFLWLALVLLRDFAFTLMADTFTTSPKRRSAVILLYLLFMYVAIPAALQALSSEGSEWWLPTAHAAVPIVMALTTLLAMFGALMSQMPPSIVSTKS